MKPNWSLIAGSAAFVVAVFAAAVLDGFNTVEATTPHATPYAATAAAG